MGSRLNRTIYIACIMLVVISVLIMVTSVYPACFPDDAGDILNDIFHHDRWRDWHPVTYYLYLRICMKPFENPYAVVLVQGIIAVFAHYMVLKYLYQYHDARLCILYVLSILTIGISGFEYIVIIFKDTPYSFGLLGFTVSLLYGIRRKWDWISLILVLCWGLLAAMMRHGGWFALSLGLILISFYYVKKNEKNTACRILIMAVAICLIFCGIRSYLLSKYNVSQNPAYVSYTIPLYMLASYTEHKGSKNPNITDVMEELAPIEEWRVRYNEDIYFADPIARDDLITEHVDDKGMHFKLIKANAIYFFTEPLEYLENFFTINSIVWNPVTPSDGYVACMPSLGSGEYILVQFPEWHTQIRGMGIYIRSVFDNIKLTSWKRDIVYRGGINLIIILLAVMAMWIKRQDEALVLIPIIITVIMLMISIPQQDTRYVLPQSIVSCLALPLALSGFVCKNRDNKYRKGNKRK